LAGSLALPERPALALRAVDPLARLTIAVIASTARARALWA